MELLLLLVLVVVLVNNRNRNRPRHEGGDLVAWRVALFWLPLAVLAGWLVMRLLGGA